MIYKIMNDDDEIEVGSFQKFNRGNEMTESLNEIEIDIELKFYLNEFEDILILYKGEYLGKSYNTFYLR